MSLRRFALVASLASGCLPASGGYTGPTPAWVADTTSFPAPDSSVPRRSLTDEYRATADRILTAARADRGAFDKLQTLTDSIGNRLAGSPSLDRAIAWAAQAMKDDGLTVHTEKVMVPHWVRGREEAAIVAPIARSLTILGLGGTIGTTDGGISAPVIVVHDFAELERRKSEVRGKIVVYNVAMPAWSPERGSGYGDTVIYRTTGASRAAGYGAVAVLVRSVTARSLGTPHTGAMSYDKDQPRIPAASITVEDAELLDRLAANGAVPQIRLRLDAQTLPEVESANVIGELRGRERPDEVVMLGAHIDSWDVGQGAHDDGAGVVAMMQATRTLKALGLTPRRTIRVVLFTNEENGLRGAKAYAADHAAELPLHVAALEADSGGFAPRGAGLDHVDPLAAARARTRLADILALLRAPGLDATRLGPRGGGADIGPTKAAGVPQLSVDVDNRTYFDYHHTRADTLDKVDPQALADMTAAIAVVAYVLADMPDRIDAPVAAADAPPRPSPFEERAPVIAPVPAPAASTTEPMTTREPPWNARTPAAATGAPASGSSPSPGAPAPPPSSGGSSAGSSSSSGGRPPESTTSPLPAPTFPGTPPMPFASTPAIER